MKSLWKWLTTLMLAGLLASCGGDDTNYGKLTDVAQKNGFNALLAAANKAGLGGALAAHDADLTVFAPTDAAFATLATQLGFADAGAMVAALPPPTLANILNYHLLAGTRNSAELRSAGASLATAYRFDGAAARLGLNASSGVVLTDAVLATATVTAADVRADNGVIHAVDKVLVPPGVLTVVQMAQANPASFSALVAAIVATDLAPALGASGPFTVFAPTNSAFAAAPTGLSTAQVRSVLLYHVVAGQVLAAAIPFDTPVPTLNTSTLGGATVPAQTLVINRNLTITDSSASAAPILATDVRASNGVIHVIGKVLIPR
ncbi:fasciclin domain-containing protein [Massilia sp. DWR3-1-1]|uniref:fasciclin domain-containing protein n=1 Tax=Massilia sp. DWR3-1-1 TaxID=2804559 RepID=UPI003CF3D4DB